MQSTTLTLEWLPGTFAVVRLPATAPVPIWASRALSPESPLVSITRSADELSIVIGEGRLPGDPGPECRIERGFAAFRVAGTLDFSQVGIIARLTAPLAEAGVPVFVVSSYDTDYVLVREGQRAVAESATSRVARFRQNTA